MGNKVLLVFDDPGGGLAVSSLLNSLKEKGIEVIIFAGTHNEKLMNDMGIHFNKLNSMISSKESGKILSDTGPDLIISGTSGGNAEQEIRNRAFEKNIRSIVILDFWKDYKRRWLYSDYPVENLYDTVCVMDEDTKNEMIEENFPGAKLKVTGNPYLDLIFNSKLNEEYSTKEASNNFLFLSQPLEIIGIKGYKIHPLKVFIDGLQLMVQKRGLKNAVLTVKLHPMEKESQELSEIINTKINDDLMIELADDSKTLKELVQNSSTVTGYNTIAMFEARAMGKRTISINVVPVRDSLTAAMQTAGIEIVPCESAKIAGLLMSESLQKKTEMIFAGGIDRCMDVILNQLTFQK